MRTDWRGGYRVAPCRQDPDTGTPTPCHGPGRTRRARPKAPGSGAVHSIFVVELIGVPSTTLSTMTTPPNPILGLLHTGRLTWARQPPSHSSSESRQYRARRDVRGASVWRYTIRGFPPPRDVLTVGDRTVTLTETHETTKPGTYWLEWTGSYTMLGSIVARSPGKATRQVLLGTMPSLGTPGYFAFPSLRDKHVGMAGVGPGRPAARSRRSGGSHRARCPRRPAEDVTLAATVQTRIAELEERREDARLGWIDVRLRLGLHDESDQWG